MELDKLEDSTVIWLVAPLSTYQLGSMKVLGVANRLVFWVDINVAGHGLEEAFEL